MRQDFLENHLLITTKQTFEIFLKTKDPSDCIALYMFYYYTAKWQETNQPRASVRYVAKGLRWSSDRVRRAKKMLGDLKIIEDVRTLDKLGRVKGWYVKLNFILRGAMFKNQRVGLPEGGNPVRNALRENTKRIPNKKTAFSFGKVRDRGRQGRGELESIGELMKNRKIIKR